MFSFHGFVFVDVAGVIGWDEEKNIVVWAEDSGFKMQMIFQTINHSLLNMLNYTSPKDISIQKLKKQELTTSNSSHSKSKLNFSK